MQANGLRAEGQVQTVISVYVGYWFHQCLNEPLILLDGIPISSVAYSLLNPNDIEDLNVLKDAFFTSYLWCTWLQWCDPDHNKERTWQTELRYSFQYGRMRAQDLKKC